MHSLAEAAPWHKVVEIGFSDHLVLAPPATGPVSWSIKPETLPEYVEEVLGVREDCPIPVRLGLEVDYFPGQADIVKGLLGPYPFDYLIGSVHFVDGFAVDESAEDWEKLTEKEVNEVSREYWRRIAAMARTGIFHLAGHLDLPKKFSFRPSQDLRQEIGAALDAIAGAGMTIELNTSGWGKPCRECYPSEPILAQAINRNIPIVVTADAHRKADLTQYYDRAFELLGRLH
ncbi:MAG: histidinol-phosphatase HisJ family protein [Acidobacteria bacterium]|nr:MAG: histidinol-phosphatase HisJ family protein [Acidobacteriota bacterium]